MLFDVRLLLLTIANVNWNVWSLVIQIFHIFIVFSTHIGNVLFIDNVHILFQSSLKCLHNSSIWSCELWFYSILCKDTQYRKHLISLVFLISLTFVFELVFYLNWEIDFQKHGFNAFWWFGSQMIRHIKFNIHIKWRHFGKSRYFFLFNEFWHLNFDFVSENKSHSFVLLVFFYYFWVHAFVKIHKDLRIGYQINAIWMLVLQLNEFTHYTRNKKILHRFIL